MTRAEIKRNRSKIVGDSLRPFKNLDIVRKYFAAVKAMDRAALGGAGFDSAKVMRLWHRDGTLTIAGRPLGGKHAYQGAKDIKSFYARRIKGVLPESGGTAERGLPPRSAPLFRSSASGRATFTP